MENFNEAVGGDNAVAVPKEFLWDKIAYIILLIVVFLMPVFFIGSVFLSVDFSKSLFLAVGVALAFTAWGIARIKEGKINLPKNLLFLLAGIAAAAYIISALLSPVPSFSFLGDGSLIGSASFILICFVLLFLISYLFEKKAKIFYFYLAVLVSFCLVFLFQLARALFGPGFLSFGLFTGAVSNFFGKWNDIGVYSSMVVILSLVTLQFLTLGKKFKIFVGIILAASLLLCAYVNFYEAWFALGVFSLLIGVYVLFYRRILDRENKAQHMEVRAGGSTAKPKFPVAPLVVLLISILFVLANVSIGNFISSKFHVAQNEIRPSLSSTYRIGLRSIENNPFFGVGPNRFAESWLVNKPVEINGTPFWDASFDYGVGFIPTLLATTGIIGFLTWCVFLVYFLYKGIRSMLNPSPDSFLSYLATSSFLAAAFLWVMHTLYVPSAVTLALAFAFTGIFAAALYQSKDLQQKRFSFSEKKKIGDAVAIFLLILLILVMLTIGYSFVVKSRAEAGFEYGASILQNANGNVNQAETSIRSAYKVSPRDEYARVLVQIDLARLNAIFNETNVSTTTLQAQFTGTLAQSLSDAKSAVSLDPYNFLNWISYGQVYQTIMPIKQFTGSYNNASAAFINAARLNPLSPTMYLDLADLEVQAGNNNQALQYLGQSLSLKGDDVDALHFLSQFDAANGNSDQAIAVLQKILTIMPNSPVIYYEIGYLQYNGGDYTDAAVSLEKAVSLNNNQFANAQYFLGLAYSKLGKVSDSLNVFEDLQKAYPNNTQIEKILSNLSANKPPLSGLTGAPAATSSKK